MINLDKNKNYLLACSYGPDSMALFSMLLNGGFHFSCALVNYHLRDESTQEMHMFMHFCEEKKIAYHVKDLVNGIIGHNVESECRKIRYQYFAELVKQFGYDAVLVAHNEDDLIETYIMQKRRHNLVMHYGIKEVSTINDVKVIRPLLKYSKQSLKDYCDENKVPYAIDSSNLEDKYLRNRIRHQIVSKMDDKERQNVIKEIDKKNEELSQLFDNLSHIDLSDADALKKLPIKEFAYAINLLVKRQLPNLSISLKYSKEILHILKHKNANVDIPLTRGYHFRKSYDHIEVIKPHKKQYCFVLEKPTIMDNEYFFLDFTRGAENRNIKEEDYPLTIRTAQKNDEYTIKDYKVKVRRLFIDWKMPLSLRERWPVIVNKDGIIKYIPRYQKDFIPSNSVNFYVK